MNARRPCGGLEAEVLALLSTGETPMTAADVRAGVDEALAYTTVLTVLSRLADKGMVRRERRGRAHAYRAVRDRSEVTARRMRRLLDADGDRAAVLTRFLGELSDDDERLLLGMLSDPRRGERS
jgi:predicted transcriptional regulator